MTTQLGIFLPSSVGSDEQLPDFAETARRVEASGLDAAWVGDHLVVEGRPLIDSTLVLASAAAVTSRIELGFSVFLPALRPLAWAARQVGSLQHLAQGRLQLGVGIGWDGLEWEAAGVPGPVRARRTDEFLDLLPAMLAGKPTRLPDGPEVTFEPVVAAPPIWIGGTSEPALRRVLRYGDGWFGALQTPEMLTASKRRLAEQAAVLGRPTPRTATVIHGAIRPRSTPGLREEYARELAASYGMPLADVIDVVVTGDPTEVADQLAPYVEAGVEKLAFIGSGDWATTCDLLAEVHQQLT